MSRNRAARRFIFPLFFSSLGLILFPNVVFFSSAVLRVQECVLVHVTVCFFKLDEVSPLVVFRADSSPSPTFFSFRILASSGLS